jgi:hypothetical protein
MKAQDERDQSSHATFLRLLLLYSYKNPPVAWGEGGGREDGGEF